MKVSVSLRSTKYSDMKKLGLLLVLLAGIISSYAQTVDDVMAKFEEANGGKNRLKAIKTLQLESVMKMNILRAKVFFLFITSTILTEMWSTSNGAL